MYWILAFLSSASHFFFFFFFCSYQNIYVIQVSWHYVTFLGHSKNFSSSHLPFLLFYPMRPISLGMFSSIPSTRQEFIFHCWNSSISDLWYTIATFFITIFDNTSACKKSESSLLCFLSAGWIMNMYITRDRNWNWLSKKGIWKKYLGVMGILKTVLVPKFFHLKYKEELFYTTKFCCNFLYQRDAV